MLTYDKPAINDYRGSVNTDSKNRRLRFAPPQPVGERIEVVDNDLIYFNAINRNGPLPTPFLHAYTPQKNMNALQYRLTKFYNGTENDPSLLSRPPEQFNSFKARYQHIAYDLSSASKDLLRERGTAIIRRTDPFVHRLFGACVTSSIELAAPRRDLVHIPRSAILAKTGSTLGIEVDGRTLVPDDLFGLRDENGATQFFWGEWDRNTESTERGDKLPNTIDKKFRGVLDVLYYGTQKSHWSIDNLAILIVTTNLTHQKNMMAHLDRLTNNKLKLHFYFKTWLSFGRRWEMPATPLTTLLTEPWDTLAGPKKLPPTREPSPSRPPKRGPFDRR